RDGSQSPRLLRRLPGDRAHAAVPRSLAAQQNRPPPLRENEAQASTADLEVRPALRRRQDDDRRGDLGASRHRPTTRCLVTFPNTRPREIPLLRGVRNSSTESTERVAPV